MAIKVIREPEPAPGKLGKAELYALSIGQVIGAGVITLIVPAIKMTGYSAWLAYLVAIFMGFLMILPNLFVASTVRMAGGTYSMLCGLAGPNIAGVFAFAHLTSCFSMSLFGTAAAAYLGDVIPALGSPGARIAVAVGLLTLFYLFNMLGMDIMAGAQKIMTWLLIAALVLFAIFGIANIKLPIFDFSNPNFLTQGWGINFTNGQISGGFLGAVLLFIYSCNGYYMTIAYGGAAKDARRDIPFAILASVPTLIVLYVGVAMAAAGSTSLEEYGTSTTLVFAARNVFPSALYVVFIIAGPIMALLSTLNSSFAYSAINIGQSCDDGWLPQFIGKKNSRGARIIPLTFVYIVSVIPILFGLSITVITNMMQLVGAALFLLNFIAYFKLPKMYPESWKKSRFHIPDGLYYALCTVSAVCFLITLWKSCLSINPALAAGNIIVIVVLIAIAIFRSRTGNIQIHTSVWAEENEQPAEEK